MKHSKQANKLIETLTPCFLKAKYRFDDPTIGYDHVVDKGNLGILEITPEEASQYLESDLTTIDLELFRSPECYEWLCTLPLQNEYDAICCLIQQIGVKEFVDSGMLKALMEHDMAEIEAYFGQYTCFGNGKSIRTSFELSMRRATEWCLFKGEKNWETILK